MALAKSNGIPNFASQDDSFAKRKNHYIMNIDDTYGNDGIFMV